MPRGILYGTTIHAPNPNAGRDSACGTLGACDVGDDALAEVDIASVLDTHAEATLCGRCFPTGDPTITKLPVDAAPKHQRIERSVANAKAPRDQ